MADESSTDRAGRSRKGLLAGVLLVAMVALMGRMVFIFWQEGDAVCQALQSQLEHTPSAQLPCSKASYSVGPIDLARTEATGSGAARSTVRYEFDDDGELRRIDTDHGDGGAAEATYRCSTLGKILMPITNYAAWSSFSTFAGLARGATPQMERGIDVGGKGVKGLRTRLKVIGNPAFTHQLMFEASTHDGDDRLHRRVRQKMVPGRLTVSDYEYDMLGNLRSRRQMFVSHPYTSSRQTDYTYECWD